MQPKALGGMEDKEEERKGGARKEMKGRLEAKDARGHTIHEICGRMKRICLKDFGNVHSKQGTSDF